MSRRTRTQSETASETAFELDPDRGWLVFYSTAHDTGTPPYTCGFHTPPWIDREKPMPWFKSPGDAADFIMGIFNEEKARAKEDGDEEPTIEQAVRTITGDMAIKIVSWNDTTIYHIMPASQLPMMEGSRTIVDLAMKRIREYLSRPVSSICGLPRITCNSLESHGMTTVGDVASRDEQELLNIRNIGRRGLSFVRRSLECMGIGFGFRTGGM